MIRLVEVVLSFVYHLVVVTTESLTKVAVAREAWRRMFDFIMATHAHRDRTLEHFGLTPGDSKVLMHLEPEVGQSMSALAQDWSCDASNATWMVDRLEQRGLVERRPVVGDRRVKAVVLTPKGIRMKAELLEELYKPPAELLELSLAELEALRDGVAKLPAPAPSETHKHSNAH